MSEGGMMPERSREPEPRSLEEMLPAVGTAVHFRWDMSVRLTRDDQAKIESMFEDIARQEFESLLADFGVDGRESLVITVNSRVGSFEAWIAVGGAGFVWTCLQVIKDYPEFKKGVLEAKEDLQKVRGWLAGRYSEWNAIVRSRWLSVMARCDELLSWNFEGTALTQAEEYTGRIERLLEQYERKEVSIPSFIIVSQALVFEIKALGISDGELGMYVESLEMALREGIEESGYADLMRS